jgi:hypothetical protein
MWGERSLDDRDDGRRNDNASLPRQSFQAAAVNLDELRLAAHEVNDHLLANLPAWVERLPRGYEVVRNDLGERSLQHSGALFNPSYAEPLPNRAAIERFGRDLKTGWLREVADRIGSERELSGEK